jgi:hypothetical protein
VTRPLTSTELTSPMRVLAVTNMFPTAEDATYGKFVATRRRPSRLPAHEGLHVTEERVIVELDAGQRVILIDLNDYAFPIIRDQNGDLAVAGDRNAHADVRVKS